MFTPHDNNVIRNAKIKSIAEVNFQRNEKLITYIGEEIDKPYLEKIKSLSMHLEVIQRQKDLKIVYTPLHGTGVYMVPRALRMFGFENISLVEAQAVPDGNFPTVKSPNPEEVEAMTMALKQAKAIDADIILATDPDADRIGVAVKKADGEYELLNGNMTLSLLVYYMLQGGNQRKINGNQYVETVVTTELVRDMAVKEEWNAGCFNGI